VALVERRELGDVLQPIVELVTQEAVVVEKRLVGGLRCSDGVVSELGASGAHRSPQGVHFVPFVVVGSCYK